VQSAEEPGACTFSADPASTCRYRLLQNVGNTHQKTITSLNLIIQCQFRGVPVARRLVEFITAFTRAHHWSLTPASCFLEIIFNIILPSYVQVFLMNCPSGFPSKIPYLLTPPPHAYKCPAKFHHPGFDRSSNV
jgi:hypothetical protein